jgi:hypothetical protein
MRREKNIVPTEPALKNRSYFVRALLLCRGNIGNMTLEFILKRSKAVTVRDFLYSVFGLEIITVKLPLFSNTWTNPNPQIDQGLYIYTPGLFVG